jgi:hypothetical protein
MLKFSDELLISNVHQPRNEVATELCNRWFSIVARGDADGTVEIKCEFAGSRDHLPSAYAGRGTHAVRVARRCHLSGGSRRKIVRGVSLL